MPSKDGLRIYIHSDQEGVVGVVFYEDSFEQTIRNYYHLQKMRRLMTMEVNAAVAGALDAGATEIYINDSHAVGYNVDYERMVAPAKLMQGRGSRRPGYLPCLDESFDAVVTTGIFATTGSPEANNAHSYMKVTARNGTYEFATYGIIASIAGHHGVPCVFASGDHVACAQIVKLVPNIELAVVKQGLGMYNARSKDPQTARDMIRRGVTQGIKRRHEIKPFRIEGPNIHVVATDNWGNPVPGKELTGDDWYEMVHAPGDVFWGDFSNTEVDDFAFPLNPQHY